MRCSWWRAAVAAAHAGLSASPSRKFSSPSPSSTILVALYICRPAAGRTRQSRSWPRLLQPRPTASRSQGSRTTAPRRTRGHRRQPRVVPRRGCCSPPSCPASRHFAINTLIAEAMVDQAGLPAWSTLFAVDPTNPMAAKTLIKTVQAGRKCVIFPEGRITVTGALMKVYEGPAMIADKPDAPILPVRIDGAQYTPFSRLRGKVRPRLFPKITITVLQPRHFDVPAAPARAQAPPASPARSCYDVMTEMVFETSDRRPHAVRGPARSARHPWRQASGAGGRRARAPSAYRRLIRGSFAARRKPRRHAPSRARRSASCCPIPSAPASPSSRCRPTAACRPCSISRPAPELRRRLRVGSESNRRHLAPLCRAWRGWRTHR